MEHRPSLTNA